jgi:alpha-ketoglutarate-dependent taurine dioxygenase
MGWKAVPYDLGSALRIQATGGLALSQLPRDEIWDLFRRAGMLLFEGFQADRRTVREFSELFSTSDEVFSPGRPMLETGAGTVQTVEPGTAPIELHRENAFLPIQPDLLWFICARPAARGGQTTFCDGAALWRALQPGTRKRFTEQRVIGHSVSVPVAHFEALLGEGVSQPDICEFLDMLHGSLPMLNERVHGLNAEGSYQVNPDGTFHVKLFCSPVIETRYGREKAFANGILVYLREGRAGSADHEIAITFDDETEIPAEVIAEVREAAGRLTGQINWAAGDVAMIDNSRYMHGRRAFDDAQREMYSLVTYAAG